MKTMWCIGVMSFILSYYLCVDIYETLWDEIAFTFWVLTVLFFIACIVTDAASKHIPQTTEWVGLVNVLVYYAGTMSAFWLITFIPQGMTPEGLFMLVAISSAVVLLIFAISVAVKGQKAHNEFKYASPVTPTKGISFRGESTLTKEMKLIPTVPVKRITNKPSEAVESTPPEEGIKTEKNISSSGSSSSTEAVIITENHPDISAPPILRLKN